MRTLRQAKAQYRAATVARLQVAFAGAAAVFAPALFAFSYSPWPEWFRVFLLAGLGVLAAVAWGILWSVCDCGARQAHAELEETRAAYREAIRVGACLFCNGLLFPHEVTGLFCGDCGERFVLRPVQVE